MEKPLKASPKYKDVLFKYIFGQKKYALYLYNALNHSHYTDADDLEIVTLKQGMYFRKRNDVAFLFHNEMFLTEQQSTRNPNMPYRFLEYVVEEYQKYVVKYAYNRYTRTMFRLPAPHFIVLYNVTGKQEEETTLHLSDMYIDGKEGDLELTVHVYNINSPYGKALKEACEPLLEYCWLVERVRRDMDKEEDKRDPEILGRVISKALDDMPDSFLIRKMLMRDRDEVIGMIFEEYDEELDRQAAEDYAREQKKLGKREKSVQLAGNLLKKVPGWSDKEIADTVQDISPADVAKLRKGLKLV